MAFEILAVVKHNSLFYSSVITLKCKLFELKQAIQDRWPELRGVVFDIYCVRGDQRRVFEIDADLHAFLCYEVALNKNTADIHINILEPPSESNHSSSLVVASSSSIATSCLPLNEVGGSEMPILKSIGWRSIFTGVGQLFKGGADDFRLSLKKYVCETGYQMKMKKNDMSRITVECEKKSSQQCGWYIHACIACGDTKFEIKRCCLEHTCGGTVRDTTKPKLTSKLVNSVMIGSVRDKPTIKPKDLMLDFKRDYGLDMTYTVAYNSRHFSLDNIHGLDDISFNRLISYKETILSSNPGSVVLLESMRNSDKFRRIFISYKASIDGFLCCRPFIYLDGTFVTAKFKGCLLATCTKNGNNGIYPLAIAVVDSETSVNWHWFLTCLRSAIGVARELTFLSDRHKGLVSSIPDVFPNSFHSYCLWHLKANLTSAIPGNAMRRALIVQKFEQLAYAPTHREFNLLLGEFHSFNCIQANNFLISIPVQNWANAYFKGLRYGQTCSSLAESFNNWVKIPRSFPITAMLDAIRKEMMKMISDRLDESRKWNDILTPTFRALLEKKSEFGRAWNLTKSSDIVYEIHAEENYMVNLGQMSCSCNLWVIEGFPCAHAVATINKAGRTVEDFIVPYFYSSYFRATYSFPIYPVVGYDKASSVPEVLAIIPPLLKRTPGRPKRKRIPNTGIESSKRKMVCRTCNKSGHHNSRTCGKQ